MISTVINSGGAAREQQFFRTDEYIFVVEIGTAYPQPLPLGEIHGRFDVNNRMIHLCLFPEHGFIFLRRLIRYYCALQYTHIVLEFWGTYCFSCFPELGWEEKSYSEEQNRLLVSEIRACGAEPIPFFNSLGHAPGSRGCSGKQPYEHHGFNDVQFVKNTRQSI